METPPILPNPLSETPQSSHSKPNLVDLTNNLMNFNMHGREVKELPTPTEDEMKQYQKKIFCKVFAPFFISVEVFKEEVNQIWKGCSVSNVEAMKGGIFMFDLEEDAVRNFIVQNSPCLVKGCCMSVRGWKEGVLLHKMDFNALDLWVQVYQLPLESINSRIGMELGSHIGSPLEAENQPCINENGIFQRIKVKLQVRDPLPLGIEFLQKDGNLDMLLIKIENLDLFCFKCGRVGHDKGKCMYGFSLMPGVVQNVKQKRYSADLKGITPKGKEIIFLEVYEPPKQDEMSIDNAVHVHAEAKNDSNSGLEEKRSKEADAQPTNGKKTTEEPLLNKISDDKNSAVKGKAVACDTSPFSSVAKSGVQLGSETKTKRLADRYAGILQFPKFNFTP